MTLLAKATAEVMLAVFLLGTPIVAAVTFRWLLRDVRAWRLRRRLTDSLADWFVVTAHRQVVRRARRVSAREQTLMLAPYRGQR